MKRRGEIEETAESDPGNGHGVWRLLVPRKLITIEERRVPTWEVIYWYVRRYPGNFDEYAWAKAVGVHRWTVHRALQTLVERGLVSYQRFPRPEGMPQEGVWVRGDVRSMRAFEPGEALYETSGDLPPELERLINKARKRATGSAASSLPPPVRTPPHLPSTAPPVLQTLALEEGPKESEFDPIGWRLEVRDTVWNIYSQARMLDPLAVLPNDPLAADAFHPVCADSIAQLGRLQSMVPKKAASSKSVAQRIRSVGRRTTVSFPTVAPSSSRQRTLYHVGSAKLRALTEAFREQIPDYQISREDNEGVRSPAIGWHCQAWVDAYVAGEDYDPYELEFDPETDERFVAWQAGLTFVAENSAIWDEFWNLVGMESAQVTGEEFSDEEIRRIETWVWFAGDKLAEEIGAKQGPEAWLAAGRVLGQWVFQPMHDVIRERGPHTVTPEEWRWVMLFAIGFAQANSDLLGSKLRAHVLTTLAAIRYKGAWGLSPSMLQRLGFTGDYEALRQEGAELLAQRAADGAGIAAAIAPPEGARVLTQEVPDADTLRNIYEGDFDQDDLPELVSFGIQEADVHVVSRFAADRYHLLSQRASRDGDATAAEALTRKADIITGPEPRPLDDFDFLAEPVDTYDEEPPSVFDWLLALRGGDLCAEGSPTEMS